MKLTRTDYRLDGIFGVLTNEDGDWVAMTLEHSFAGMVSKVPAGIYQCVRGMHSLHSHPEPFETFEVTGVEHHTGILFHCGNWNCDSDGCILLGHMITTSPNGQMVTSSHATFAAFMKSLDGMDTFPLTIVDGVTA